MESPDAGKRLVIDADLEGSVIRGPLTEPSGDEREFHGWLALTAAIESALRDKRAGSSSDSAAKAREPLVTRARTDYRRHSLRPHGRCSC
jgi:hypothetical protein